MDHLGQLPGRAEGSELHQVVEGTDVGGRSCAGEEPTHWGYVMHRQSGSSEGGQGSSPTADVKGRHGQLPEGQVQGHPHQGLQGKGK